jgi:hypothetical protein
MAECYNRPDTSFTAFILEENPIKNTILTMAAARGSDKTICPSEVARAMFGDDWRNQMRTVRDAAFDLAEENQVIVMQKGKKVSSENLKGPIRIKIIDRET